MANVATFLLATSPWFLFLGASLMTHTLTLFCVLMAATFLVSERLGNGRLLMVGLFLGGLFTVRPLDGLLFGAIALAAILWLRRVRPLDALVYCLGCGLMGGLMFVFNYGILDTLTTTPINDYIDRIWQPGANRLGFGSDIGNPPDGGWGSLDPLRGHGLADVLLNLNQNMHNLNFELFGCGAGSLILLLSHAIWGKWNRGDRLAASVALSIAALYSLYWFSGGPDFGPRYWFLMLPSVLWLSAQGLSTLVERSGQSRRVRGALAMSLIAALLVFVPWRAATRYHDYRSVNADIREAARRGDFVNAVVLIPDIKINGGLYRSAFVLNDPALPDDRPIFVRDLGGDVFKRLREAYPKRPFLRWENGSAQPLR